MTDNNVARPVPLPPKVKTFAYAYDPTGRSPQNKIVNEVHTITPQNRSRFNVVIPSYAPFFRNSLEIVNQQTGHRLIESIDFTCEWRVAAAADKLENLQPIYGGIQFIDNEITGTFLITYQTIGGQFTIGSTEIAQALANQANDPLITNYDDIISKPLVFPPLEHVHSIKDFVGFDHVVAVLELIKEALINLAKEDRDSHPGYDTLVEEYFRLSEAVNNLKNLQSGFKEDVAADLNALKKELIPRIADAVQNMNNTLRSKTDDMERRLRELIALINEKLKELTDKINNDLEALKRYINARLGEMNETIASNHRELTAGLQQAKTSLQQSLNEAKNELDRKLEELKNQFARDQARQDAIINSNKTKNDEQDRRLAEIEKALNGVGSGNNIVLTLGDQNIDGNKTFIKPIGVRHNTDATRVAKIYLDSVGFKLQNPFSNRLLELRNDGDLYYNNQRVILKNEFDAAIAAASNAGADWNTNLKNIPNTIMYNNQQAAHIYAPNVDQFTGFNLHRGGKRWAFEIESGEDGRFKLYRSDEKGNYYFPIGPGEHEVASRAWVNDQLNGLWQAINLNTQFRNSFTFEY